MTLEREKKNSFDGNAIQIVVHITPIHRRKVIEYVPAGFARELSRVIHMGNQVKASLVRIIEVIPTKRAMEP